MLLGGVVLLGEVLLGGVLVGDVPAGLVLPGAHGGLATVAEVPSGRDGLAEATVLELPVVVDGVTVPVDGAEVVASSTGAIRRRAWRYRYTGSSGPTSDGTRLACHSGRALRG